MDSAALAIFDDHDDSSATELVTLPIEAAPAGPDRRRNDRRGTGIPVIWFHGDRRMRSDRRQLGERRNLNRVAVELEVEEVLGHHTYFRVSADLSETGLSVHHALSHPQGTTVRLRFTLPDDRARVVRCWAVVTGTRDGGRGMRYRFVSLDREDRLRIARYVRHEASLRG